jgi:hypothetical protein
MTTWRRPWPCPPCPPPRPAAPLAAVKSPIAVAGYPVGGDSLSITKGIVSRVSMVRYSQSGRLLGIQIDAAINPGRGLSVCPCVRVSVCVCVGQAAAALSLSPQLLSTLLIVCGPVSCLVQCPAALCSSEWQRILTA